MVFTDPDVISDRVSRPFCITEKVEYWLYPQASIKPWYPTDVRLKVMRVLASSMYRHAVRSSVNASRLQTITRRAKEEAHGECSMVNA